MSCGLEQLNWFEPPNNERILEERLRDALMDREETRMDWIKWWKAAGIRAAKTVAQTAVSMLGVGVIGVLEVDWVNVASVSLLAGIVSMLTSLAGLPELEQ